jgi:hypothetical protein
MTTDPLDIADFRLRKLERLFRNFIIIGDGVGIDGDMSAGYAVTTPPNLSPITEYVGGSSEEE